MIEINNKHVVLMLLIIIIGVFIYNYDVYVIPKNEPLCKPVYVTKREISPEIRAELNKTESEILKETFDNLAGIEYFESFDNSNSETTYDVPPKTFSSFVIPSLTNQHKIKVIDSVIKILSYIPTNYCETQIKQLVEYFAIIYETSPNLESFYKNIASSTKIKESPYNSKYSHLILFLIGKFDNDYLSCTNSKNSDEQYAMNEQLKEIINKKNNGFNESNVLNGTNTLNDNNEYNNTNNSYDQGTSLDYLSEPNNEKIKNETKFNPKAVLNIIEKSKKKNNLNTKTESDSKTNIILPKIHSNSFPDNLDISSHNSSREQNYLDKLYLSDSEVPNFINPITNNISNLSKPSKLSKLSKPSNPSNPSNLFNQTGMNKYNGSKCSYKCDSSYSNTITHLDKELKPIENFGTIYDDYAYLY